MFIVTTSSLAFCIHGIVTGHHVIMVVVYGRQGVGGSIICYLVSTASRLGVWKVIFIYLQNYLALSVRTGPLIQRVWVMRLHFHEAINERLDGWQRKKCHEWPV